MLEDKKTKRELYEFFGETLIQINSTNKDNAASVEEKSLTLEVQNTRYDTGCNLEKAGARVFLHAGSIVPTSSSPHLPTKTVKTDVLVLINAVELFPNFKLKEF